MKWRPCGTFNVSYKQELSIIRLRFHWIVFIAFLAFIFLLPQFIPLSLLDFLIRTTIILIIILGLQLLMGYCGQISLGHAAFACVGAFTGAILLKYGVPYIVGLAFAGIAAGLTGLLFGLPAVRIKGLYLAISTLAAHFLVMFVIVHFAGGATGYAVPPPKVLGFQFTSDVHIYYLVLCVLIILTYGAKNLTRSKAGRAFVAVRDHEIAAHTLGVNIFSYKLLAFIVSCFYAGVGGFLWVTYLQWASVEHFPLWQAVWYVGIIVVGGLGRIEGAFLGTLFFEGLNDLCSVMAPAISRVFPAFGGTVIAALPILVFSILLIVFIIFEPRGMAHRWRLMLASFRLYPFNY